MTGRLETVDDRPALRFERRLNHPVARVWRAVTEPDELERWFVAPVDWKPEAGEVFEALGQTGRITELEPPHVIAWVWGDELFRFDLEPGGRGLPLVFTHVFDERRYDHGVERVWRALTDRDELDNCFPPGRGLEVTDSQPPHLLAGSWYGDELRFELRPDGDGCVLAFTTPSPIAPRPPGTQPAGIAASRASRASCEARPRATRIARALAGGSRTLRR
jgi:uncharacterized protein YndB with AHSA1/START domain